MDTKLDDRYWSERYINKETGWDIGYASGPLTAFIDSLSDLSIDILIPGCGNAYEADYLLKKGFHNITLIDISREKIKDLGERYRSTPVKVLHQNFFDHEGSYDLILEQTFFCALDPALRENYVVKMVSLLKDNGMLAGVLFNKEFEGGPPFGGTMEEYKLLFGKYFSKVFIEPCYNSIEPRAGTEVFIKIKKRKPELKPCPFVSES